MSEASKENANRETDEAPQIDPVAGKSVAEIFGEIVWLMSQDKDARELQIKDLERLVMPPILLRQFHITYAPVPSGRSVKGEPVSKTGNEKPVLQPIAVELFAMCSEDIASKIDGLGDIALKDWRSGEHRHVVLKFGKSAGI